MTEKRNKPISRREALKAIGAVTGVTVLSAARGDWETPLVQVGALPAHAQGSGGTILVDNQTLVAINVTIEAAASMKAANGVCDEGTKILDDDQKEFYVAPGNYTVNACAPTSNRCFTNDTKSATVVEGETKIVTFECTTGD